MATPGTNAYYYLFKHPNQIKCPNPKPIKATITPPPPPPSSPYSPPPLPLYSSSRISSIQKPIRQIRAPDMYAILGGGRFLGGVARVDQVSVDVVLEDEVGGIEPVVEDLRPHDVPPDAPAVGVALNCR